MPRIHETDSVSVEEEANTLVPLCLSFFLALALSLSLGLLPRRRDGEQFHDRMADLLRLCDPQKYETFPSWARIKGP